MASQLWLLCRLSALLVLPCSAVTGDFLNCAAGQGQATFAIPVRVMRRSGMPVENLGAADFGVSVDGARMRICGFNHGRYPVSLGIVMDTSASMQKTGVALAKAGIGRVLDESGPGDEYFLAHVGERPEPVAFTTDVKALRPALEREPIGKTALIDQMYLALDAMKKARHTNRALLVVSDGGDNHSLFRSDELERAFTAAPFPIFLIVPMVNVEPSRGRAMEEDDSPLLSLAAKSAGFAWRVAQHEDMVYAATCASALIRSTYTLYFDAVPGAARPNLTIEVKGARPRPRVLYRGMFQIR